MTIRLRFPLRIAQGDFDQFLKTPIAVIMAKRRPETDRLFGELSNYFDGAYPDDSAVGMFDKASVVSPRWFLGKVNRGSLAASWPQLAEIDEAPDGFYLFRKGKPVAFHSGVAAEDQRATAGIGLVALLAGVDSVANAAVNHMAKQNARAVVDHFEAVLAQTPSRPKGTKPARDENVRSFTEPYATLKITAAASDVEVKAARDKAIFENHPDRVAHMSEEIQALAKERTLLVNEAYNAILKKRAAR